jgi:hypothetical protein
MKVEGQRPTASNGSDGTRAIAQDGFFDGRPFYPSDLRGYLSALEVDLG